MDEVVEVRKAKYAASVDEEYIGARRRQIKNENANRDELRKNLLVVGREKIVGASSAVFSNSSECGYYIYGKVRRNDEIYSLQATVQKGIKP